MNHVEHTTLVGYDARQIWHDGCTECEELGMTVPYSIAVLDDFTLVRALKRSARWRRNDLERVGLVSIAETQLLTHLASTLLVMRRLRHIGVGSEEFK